MKDSAKITDTTLDSRNLSLVQGVIEPLRAYLHNSEIELNEDGKTDMRISEKDLDKLKRPLTLLFRSIFATCESLQIIKDHSDTQNKFTNQDDLSDLLDLTGNVKKLNLNSEILSEKDEEGTINIASLVHKMPQLEELKINANGIENFDFLDQLRSLRNLSLYRCTSHNGISSQSLEELELYDVKVPLDAAISHLPNLRSLSIKTSLEFSEHGSSFHRPSAYAGSNLDNLFEGISKLPNLEFLNLEKATRIMVRLQNDSAIKFEEEKKPISSQDIRNVATYCPKLQECQIDSGFHIVDRPSTDNSKTFIDLLKEARPKEEILKPSAVFLSPREHSNEI